MTKYSKYYEPLATLIVSILLFQFLFFPGLTIASTIINLITILGIIIWLVSVISLFNGRFSNYFISKVVNIEPGETELDYIPEEEIKKTKKPTSKAKVKKIVAEASVKDKPKKPKKPEFPMEPHKPRVVTKKSEPTKSKVTPKKK
jgi:hypothetical protein